ncbi:MAG: VCBS repeat-containing protein, partial [Deltaproteobacteria bacterium]|nr:VCBS repeat-containing protein [Deltaproteobacteria bacterium]
MRLSLSYPKACLGLVLVGCPTDGSEDDGGSVPTSTATGTGSDTQTPGSGETDSPMTGPTDTTGPGCPAGEVGCPCLPDRSCVGMASCEAGTCQDPNDPDTTDGDTTSGGPAMCGNGTAEPGDLCLGESTPFAMGAGTIDVLVGNFDADPALDVVVANRDANTVAIRLGDGTGDLGVQTSFAAGTGPVAIGAGDFDND